MLYVLLPCYNEEKNVGRLLEEIAKALLDFEYVVVAVDDGSVDSTYSILRSHAKAGFPLVVLRHESNKGLHEALRTLLTWFHLNAASGDLAVTMDADLTHDPSLIPLMARVASGGCSIVVASRYVRGAQVVGVPLFRRFLSRGLSLAARLMLGTRVKDVSSGYRCYSYEAIRKMFEEYGERLVASKGFEVQLELLYKAAALGLRICEVPILLDYSVRGKSKLKLYATVKSYAKMLVKYGLRRLAGVGRERRAS